MREEKKKVKSIVGGGAGSKFLLNIQFQTNYRQALQFILSDKNIFIKYIPLIPQTPALYISISIKTLHKLQLQMAHTNKSKVNKKESGGKNERRKEES